MTRSDLKEANRFIGGVFMTIGTSTGAAVIVDTLLGHEGAAVAAGLFAIGFVAYAAGMGTEDDA